MKRLDTLERLKILARYLDIWYSAALCKSDISRFTWVLHIGIFLIYDFPGVLTAFAGKALNITGVTPL